MQRNTQSSNGLAIRLHAVTKHYRLNDTPMMRLRQALLGRDSGAAIHRAIAGVSLDIPKGETVGLIGSNGAGKSTLLQIITGTLEPSAGEVAVSGRVSALLELGAGFNPDWTGRRNAEFQCVLQGVPPRELPERIAAIEAFADIGPYFDQPTRTYSSGMFLRVAFAAAIATEPDILIVDEALAVGDVRFQNKCYARFRELQARGATIIFVTHSLELVKQFCTRGIVLDGGRVLFDGPPQDAVARFLDLLYGKEAAPGPAGEPSPEAASAVALSTREGAYRDRIHFNPSFKRTGGGAAEMLDFALLAEDGSELERTVGSGARVTLELRAIARRDLERPFFGWIIKGVNDIHIHGSNTEMAHRSLQPVAAGTVFETRVGFRLDLAAGTYFLDLGVGAVSGGDYEAGDWLMSAASLAVSDSGTFFGIADLRDTKRPAAAAPASPRG